MENTEIHNSQGNSQENIDTTQSKKQNVKKDLWQALKFLLFSISAGIIQTVVFTLLNELCNFSYWPSYLIALTLSVVWNFTFNRNELLNNDEPDWEYKYQNKIGKPFGSGGSLQPFGLVAIGLFESQEEIDNSPVQNFGEYRVGDIKYQDINGDGQIDSQDQIAIGYTNLPEITYGFGGTAQYKNWDFNIFFQGVARTSFFLNGSSIRTPFSSGNMERAAINEDIYGNVWMSTNTPEQNANVTYPRLSMGSGGAGASNNSQASTWWLRDGSFLRLKSVEIGYSLPKSLLQKSFIKSLRFYAAGNNLLQFSPFKLWDPEKGSTDGSGYPLNRMFSIGFNANF